MCDLWWTKWRRGNIIVQFTFTAPSLRYLAETCSNHIITVLGA